MTSPREDFPFYVGTDKDDISAMLSDLKLDNIEQLYSHIDQDNLLDELNLPAALNQDDLKKHISEIASKNIVPLSFIGDGLQNYSIPKIVAKVCDIRGLTTAYTPYQPERSQGTLQTLWIYQSVMSAITGFEAINASLYDRSTCLFEALNCATRIVRGTDTVIVADTIYPGDKEVLETIAKETKLNIIYAPINKETGTLDLIELASLVKTTDKLAAIAYPQITNFGCIENFDKITNICHENKIQAIAIVDPIALANTGLKEPAKWGSSKAGADILVAEGQHLTLEPNYGGPGLGIFGIRYSKENKSSIRATAGRFIGKTIDENGDECKAIILATREQHIRREKATSNICSNQSFIATACGASILNKGHIGLQTTFNKAQEIALTCAQELTKLEGVDLKFNTPFFNEFTLKISDKVDLNEIILKAKEEQLEIGVNISKRCGINESLLLVSLTDKHTLLEVNKITRFFTSFFKKGSISSTIPCIHENVKRVTKYHIPTFDTESLYDYYSKLGQQNLSPDDGIYPLGSCTMKYNPEINDWAASLHGFTKTHPQSDECFVQGNLEILFEIQNWFKEITGLPAVTTQPVAGAQGELVGLKMFQAYHRDNAEAQSRNIILIPKSAHGTNPATATMAGYLTSKDIGIVHINANDKGEMDFDHIKSLVEQYKERISGVMVTNPNTSGIFETNFKKMSELIHSVGGLVYMDGANMNAIAGWIDLDKLGVDAVHNNLHKTWAIPHGGGGPGDAIVAVSDKLSDYLPGQQIVKTDGVFSYQTPLISIGSFHRHHGNFAHKVRAYTYLRALGAEGIKLMSATAVLSARYLYFKLKDIYTVLPTDTDSSARMHEFILTLSDENFKHIAEAGTPKAQAMAKLGKLFLDFGFHAPTVAFPEVYGIMLEPTESFSKKELDGFCEVVKTIHQIITEYPQILQTVPHFTPVAKVNEVAANKTPQFAEEIWKQLPEVKMDKISSSELRNLPQAEIIKKILEAHKARL